MHQHIFGWKSICGVETLLALHTECIQIGLVVRGVALDPNGMPEPWTLLWGPYTEDPTI